MTIFKHEMKRGRISLLVWSGAIAFMLAVCVLVYPEMSAQMNEMSDMFANMGALSDAFGMDQINFGEFAGFFGIECGNTLGMGGAFFAALLGISALAKEEKENTAEFLLTHPVSRTKIVAEKLFAVVTQVVILNVIIVVVTALSTLIIGEKTDTKTFALLFLAYFLMQLEIAMITFGISAFLHRGSLGIGLGLAACFYVLNIVANLTDKVEFLKYFTPFSYADGSDIINNKAIDGTYLAIGITAAVVAVIIAFCKYRTKDIR